MKHRSTMVLPAIALVGAGVLVKLYNGPAAVLEACLILAVFYPLTRYEPLTRLFGQLDTRYQIVSAGLLILVITGHLVPGNPFPFVTWSMYGKRVEGEPVVYEYWGTLQSGTTVPLRPSRFLPPLAARRMLSTPHRQINRLRSPGEHGQHAELRQQHEATLVALGRRHNHYFPAQLLETVVVSSKVIRLQPLQGSAADTRQVLWKVRVQ